MYLKLVYHNYVFRDVKSQIKTQKILRIKMNFVLQLKFYQNQTYVYRLCVISAIQLAFLKNSHMAKVLLPLDNVILTSCNLNGFIHNINIPI